MNKKWKIILWGAIIAGLVILTVIASIFFIVISKKTTPTVSILQPSQNLSIQSGQGLILVVEGRSDDGITHIELLEDDLLISKQLSPQSSLPVFQTAFAWFGNEIGIHTLTVISYNNEGTPSEPAQIKIDVSAAQSALGLVSSDDNQSVDSESSTNNGEDNQTDQTTNDNADIEDSSSDDQGQSSSSEEDNNEQSGIDGNNSDIEIDLPPSVSLDINPERNGANVLLNITATASDDIGLNYIEIKGRSNENDQALNYINPAGGAQNISAEFSEQLSQGEWTFVAQAFDLSGQSSELVSQSISLTNNEAGGLPIIAISGFSIPLSFENQINQNWEINSLWSDIPFNINALHDFLYPENLGVGIEDDGCLIFTAGEIEGGIGLQLEVNCNYIAPLNNYIIFKTEQYAGNYGQVTRFPIEGWNDIPRTALEQGEVLEVIDQEVSCSTKYTYSIQVGFSTSPYTWFGFRPLSEPISVNFETMPCQGDPVGDSMYLHTTPLPDGNQINWGFYDGNWPDHIEFPYDYDTVEIRLVRFLPDRNIQDYIPTENRVFRPQDLPGTTFEFIDTDILQFCDEPIFYSLFMLDPGIAGMPVNVYAQETVMANLIPCPATAGIRSLDINIDPKWNRSFSEEGDMHLLYAEVSTSFTNFDWQDEVSTLNLVISSFEENQQVNNNNVLSLEVGDRFWNVTSLRESFGPESGIECGGNHYAFFYELFSPGEEGMTELSDRSRTYHWTSPPCPPGPPVLESLHSTSDCAESIYGGCMTISWATQDIEDNSIMGLDQYGVLTPRGLMYFPSYQTSCFYDFPKPEPLSDGDTYAFVIYGCNSNRVCGSASNMLNIHIPPTPDTWDIWSYDFSSGR